MGPSEPAVKRMAVIGEASPEGSWVYAHAPAYGASYASRRKPSSTILSAALTKDLLDSHPVRHSEDLSGRDILPIGVGHNPNLTCDTNFYCLMESKSSGNDISVPPRDRSKAFDPHVVPVRYPPPSSKSLVPADHTDTPPAESRPRDELNGRKWKTLTEKNSGEKTAHHGNTPTPKAQDIPQSPRRHDARSSNRHFRQQPTFKEEQRSWMPRATSSGPTNHLQYMTPSFPLSESTEGCLQPGGGLLANPWGPPSLPYSTVPPPLMGPYLSPYGRVNAIRYGHNSEVQPPDVNASVPVAYPTFPPWFRPLYSGMTAPPPWPPFPGVDGSAAAAAQGANPAVSSMASIGPFVGPGYTRADSSTSTSTPRARPFAQDLAHPKDLPTLVTRQKEIAASTWVEDSRVTEMSPSGESSSLKRAVSLSPTPSPAPGGTTNIHNRGFSPKRSPGIMSRDQRAEEALEETCMLEDPAEVEGGSHTNAHMSDGATGVENEVDHADNATAGLAKAGVMAGDGDDGRGTTDPTPQDTLMTYGGPALRTRSRCPYTS